MPAWIMSFAHSLQGYMVTYTLCGECNGGREFIEQKASCLCGWPGLRGNERSAVTRSGTRDHTTHRAGHRGAVLVQDGVHFRVADVGVLGLEGVAIL